ncbi:hypothetical protein ABW21_db0207064 [Orbilia brochopaga]|nr:hypothetical protein ABW21_db0207064 [Drechslerella brochopaga]
MVKLRKSKSLHDEEKENAAQTRPTNAKQSGFPSSGYLTPSEIKEESETESTRIPETSVRRRRRPASPLGDLRARRTLGDDFEVLRDASSRHNGKTPAKGQTLVFDAHCTRGPSKPILEGSEDDEVDDEEEMESEDSSEQSDEASQISLQTDDLEELERELGNLAFEQEEDDLGDSEYQDDSIDSEEQDEDEDVSISPPLPNETETGLRATPAQLLESWHREKAAIIAQSRGAAVTNRSVKFATPQYRRPPRRLRKLVGRPATKLFHHLGLINRIGEPTGTAARKVHRWLRREDSLLLDQVSLVAPRLQFPHIRDTYTDVFLTVRPRVLDYLRKHHKEATWCLFFSEFVYFSPRHEGASGVCLFLMVSDGGVPAITRAIENLLDQVPQGRDMAVIPLPLSTKVTKTRKGKGKADLISRWSPSPTPPPGSPVQNILKLQYDAQGCTTWAELEPFNYGMRWVTNLAVPSAAEGMNAEFEMRPSIGTSLGNRQDSGSGTLGGYLHDGKGNCYVMSCHHVMKLDDDSVWPTPSDYLKGRTAVAPAQHDLYVATKTHGHELDGMVHEAVGAHLRGDDDLASQIAERGRRKLTNHDLHVKLIGRGGAQFGKIEASAWRIAHTKEGPWLMDQVIVKPFDARIGSNTFTYTGRDNKEGKRYRLEARGWTDLPLGAEVLKNGRTTGLTKGTIIALDADIRLCVGTERTNDYSKMTKRFWEIKTGVITSGTGPWFSEPGDSGAWILRPPAFEDMLSWDLRRRYARAAADPIAAPVGGMMFGGADSVDGISLTYYNPTKLIRRYLAKMMDGGEELVPGIGGPLPEPALLEEIWHAEDVWSRQSQEAREKFEAFAERNFLPHHLQRFGDDHIFRRPGWYRQWDHHVEQVMKAETEHRDEEMVDAPSEVPSTRLRTTQRLAAEQAKKQMKEDADVQAGHKRQNPEVRVPRTPLRRRGTSEEAPDTPTPKNNALTSRGPQRRPAVATSTPMHTPTTSRAPKTAPAKAPSTLRTPSAQSTRVPSKIPAPKTQPAKVPSTLRTPLRRPQSTLLTSAMKARKPPSKVQAIDSDGEVELA